MINVKFYNETLRKYITFEEMIQEIIKYIKERKAWRDAKVNKKIKHVAKLAEKRAKVIAMKEVRELEKQARLLKREQEIKKPNTV